MSIELTRDNSGKSFSSFYKPNTWKNIQCFIDKLKDNFTYNQIFQTIDREPITCDYIDTVIRRGWKVVYGNVSYCNKYNKEIHIGDGDQGEFERDVTLFHELIHIKYELNDSYPHTTDKINNTVITEWLARILRTDPVLLNHAVLSFGLEVQVYDRVSLQAFNPTRFQELENYLQGLQTILNPDINPYDPQYISRFTLVRMD